MSEIKFIKALEILDSRGNPTVEVSLKTDKGLFRASVPSGASTGKFEALELRDKDERYFGKGVRKAVDNINNIIAKKLVGYDCTKQQEIDNLMIELDGTPNKEKLGANAILAVSMAVCKAAAYHENLPLYSYIGKLFSTEPKFLPIPLSNVINGGKHAGQENSIQEHMIVPIKAKSFSEALRMTAETYHTLKDLLKKRFGAHATLIADEGGFAPKELTTVNQRLEIILEAIKKAGYENEIKLAIDAAASEFFNNNIYTLEGKNLSGGELIDFYSELIEKYPIISIEDGLAEEDWQSWEEMTKKLGSKIQIVGDDIFVTNKKRIEKGINLKCANAVLIKLNQIGTLTETLEAIRTTFNAGWNAVISHRSGETEDSFIADLAVGVNAKQIKTGAPARSDRNAKYNQLLRIEQELKNNEYPEIFT